MSTSPVPRLRVALVTCAFPPELVVTAGTSRDIAFALSSRDHQVTVIAPYPSRPPSVVQASDRGKPVSEVRNTEGARLRLIHCRSFLSVSSTMFSRFLENVSFGLTSLLAVVSVGRVDVLYLNTWPIFATFGLAVYCRLRGIPFVLNVQDVYPESLAVQNRVSASSLLYSIFRKVDRVIAKGAKAIVVPTLSFQKVYAINRDVSPDFINLVPNWNRQPDSAGVQKKAIPKLANRRSGRQLVLVYCGNVGVASGLLEILPWFRDTPADVKLLIAGEGDRLSDCRDASRNLPAGRVIFHSPLPAGEMPGVLEMADVFLLPTKGAQSLASMPSKLISYMMAEKPIIALGENSSDLAEVIRSSSCGWTVEPEDREGFLSLLRKFQSLPGESLAQMGHQGREYAEEHYCPSKCTARVADLIEQSASALRPISRYR